MTPLIATWSPDGWQPLHLAAYFGRVEAARLLLDADAPVSEPSRNPMAVHPLHAAAAGRHAELVWLLIASDAPVDVRSRAVGRRCTRPRRNGDLESIKALLAVGADPESPTTPARPRLDLAEDDAVLEMLRGEQE